MNYRNESVIARVAPPGRDRTELVKADRLGLRLQLDRSERPRPECPTGAGLADRPGSAGRLQVPGLPCTDPAAPSDRIARARRNEPTDPFTPLLRAYAGDHVQVRVLVVRHTHGALVPDPGRALELRAGLSGLGLQERPGDGHLRAFRDALQAAPRRGDHPAPGLLSFADYLVSPSSTVEGLANGDWAIMRAFAEPSGRPGTRPPRPRCRTTRSTSAKEPPAPRPDGSAGPGRSSTSPTTKQDQVHGEFSGHQCHRDHRLSGAAREEAAFNPRPVTTVPTRQFLLFVRDEDLDAYGQLKPGARESR